MRLVPYRIASVLLAWSSPDTGLYLVWPQEENPRGKERRRSETLNPEGHLGTKAFTVSTVGRFPAFLFFYLREKIGRGWREKWAAMMAVQLHFFFFLPAHLVEENSLDLNVSYSN